MLTKFENSKTRSVGTLGFAQSGLAEVSSKPCVSLRPRRCLKPYSVA